MVSSMAIPNAIAATGAVAMLRGMSNKPIVPKVNNIGTRFGSMLMSANFSDLNRMIMSMNIAVDAM